MQADTETIHVTSVALAGRAVLLEGPSGIGKSDLALRLIDRGAQLVSDDYTIVRRDGASLVARPPSTIAGQMEVRGIGIISVPFLKQAPVALLITLGEDVPRMPDPAFRQLAGVSVPVLALDPRPASAALKVELALQSLEKIA